MELIRAWRLEDEGVRAGGVEVEWLLWQCETLASFSDGAAVFVGLPTREQSALVSPTSPACVPQDHLEPVLLSHLRSLGSTRIAQGTQLVGLASLPDGVRATLRHARSGETRVVHARYLVAADGAYSLIRRALGIDMCGPERIFEGITTQFRAPLWDVLRDCRYGIYGVNRPDASRIFLPAGPEDRWRYGFIRDHDGPHLAEYSEDRLAAEIRAGAGVADLPLELERSRRSRRAPSCRPLPTRERLPRRRRRPPRDSPGRNRDEHGRSRRLRPRLEARMGLARLGSAGPP